MNDENNLNVVVPSFGGVCGYRCGLSSTAWATAYPGVRALAERVSQELARVVTFTTLTGDNLGANGEARISPDGDGTFTILATDARMAAFALGEYIQKIAKGHLSWCGNQIPTTWPMPTETMTVKPLYPYAIAYNYCTLSYTMAFWGKEAWQVEIDRLALQGYNIALVTAGLQKVWKLTLKDMGYSDGQIQKFIADDAASAWWHMGNLEAQGNPAKNSIAYPVNDAQIELDGEYGAWMVQQMRAVGIEPIIQSFVGLIPSTTTVDQLANLTFTAEEFAALGLDREKLTALGLAADTAIGTDNVEIFTMGSYQADQKSPNILNPAKSAFDVFSAAWNKNLKVVYGFNGDTNPNPKFLGGDLFHEASTGNMTEAEITACATKLQAAQQAVFPNAKWVVQSWEGSPKQPLQNGFDPDYTLIQKLDQDMRNTGTYANTAKANTTYKNNTTGEYLPWVWVEVINFGGNTGMHGAFPRLRHLNNIPTDESRAYFKGYGLLSEGLETNPTSYALFADAFAKNSATAQNVSDEQMATWLTDYRMRRYGLTVDNENLKKAHDLCAETVWNCAHSEQGTLESVFCAMPAWNIGAVSSWGPNGPTAYDREKLVTAANFYLQAVKADASLWTKETFKYDFVEIFQQVLADKARELLPDCKDNKDLRDQFREMIALLDEILSYSDEWRLDAKEARLVKVAAGTDAKAAYRRMVTTWTPGSYGDTGLSEYAHRSYAGLIEHYYGARWKKFLDVANETATQSEYDAYVSDLRTSFPVAEIAVTTGDDYVKTAEAILNIVLTKTFTWNGAAGDNKWATANWESNVDESTVAWEDGTNARFEGNSVTVTADEAVTVGGLEVMGLSSYKSMISRSGTSLGWTGLSIDDLMAATYTAYFGGSSVSSKQDATNQPNLLKRIDDKNVTMQFHINDNDTVKVIEIKLTIESNGSITATHVYSMHTNTNAGGVSSTIYPVGSDFDEAFAANNYQSSTWATGSEYNLTNFRITPLSTITLNGPITVTGTTLLNDAAILSMPSATVLPAVEVSGSTGTILLADEQTLTIQALEVASSGRLIIKGSASSLPANKLFFKTADNVPYKPKTGTVVYVSTGDANAVEQAVTVDMTTGEAKSILPVYAMGAEAYVKASETATGWTGLTIDDLVNMEFKGTMCGKNIPDTTKGTVVRACQVKKNAAGDAVLLQVQVPDGNNVKGLGIELKIQDNQVVAKAHTIYKESASVGDDLWDNSASNYDIEVEEGGSHSYSYGVQNLTATPAVAQIPSTKTNYASFSEAYDIAKTGDKSLSLIADHIVTQKLGHGVTLTVEPGVVLYSGLDDALIESGEGNTINMVVKGTLDLADHRWIWTSGSNLTIYTGGKILGSGQIYLNQNVGAIDWLGSSSIQVVANAGTTATIEAPLRPRGGSMTLEIPEGLILQVVDIINDTYIGPATITKTGAGTLQINGSVHVDNTLKVNAGVIEYALPAGASVKVQNATESNTVITSANGDYEVVQTREGDVTTYTSTQINWVAKVTSAENATSYSEGVKFRTLEEAMADLLTKLPNGRLWLYVTLDSDPEGWKSESGPSGAELWPIAATVNGTAYRSIEAAIAAANGDEITVVDDTHFTVPTGWTVVDGKLVYPTVYYTDGTDWTAATWKQESLTGETCQWVNGMNAVFAKDATLTATDKPVVKTLALTPQKQAWGGTSSDEILSNGTDLGWSGLTVEVLLNAHYSAIMGGSSLENKMIACSGYHVERVLGENAVTMQTKVIHGGFLKVVGLKLVVNSNGSVTAYHQGTAYKSGGALHEELDPRGTEAYLVRGLTITTGYTSTQTWGSLTNSDKIKTAADSGTNLGWSGLTVTDLINAHYTGLMGGEYINSNTDENATTQAPKACEGYFVTGDAGDSNSVTLQMQFNDGGIKTVRLKLTVNADGTVTAQHLGRGFDGSNQTPGSQCYTDSDAGYEYCMRSLTLALPEDGTPSVSVTGALDVQNAVILAQDATLSLPGVTTIPTLAVAGSSATLLLGAAQTTNIQHWNISAGGKLMIKGEASTLPAEGITLTSVSALGEVVHFPVETVYYVCTTAEDPNFNVEQELMVEEVSGQLMAVPKGMGNNIITETVVETGWTLTLTELSHMVFTGKMGGAGTEGVAAHGYAIAENGDVLSVTMKAEGQTDVTLQFTVDAAGAVWVSAPGVATDATTGVFGLEVTPATAMTLTPEDVVYSTYALLADAVVDVVEGYTVKLLTEDRESLTIATAMTLDLNGHTLSGEVKFNAATTLKGTGTFLGALSGAGNITIAAGATIDVSQLWGYDDNRTITINGVLVLKVLKTLSTYGNYTGEGTIRVLSGDVTFGNASDGVSGLSNFTGTLEVADSVDVILHNWNERSYDVTLASLHIGSNATIEMKGGDESTPKSTGTLTVGKLSGSGSFDGGTFAFAPGATIDVKDGMPPVISAVTWPTSGTLIVKLSAGTEIPAQVLSGSQLTAPAVAVKTTVYVGDVEMPDYCLKADANGLNVVQGTAKIVVDGVMTFYASVADAIVGAGSDATIDIVASVDETLAITEDVTLNVASGGILQGTIDIPEGKTLTVSVAEGGSLGACTITGAGTLISNIGLSSNFGGLTDAANWTGTFEFSTLVNDATLSAYGNANSKIRFTGTFEGYFGAEGDTLGFECPGAFILDGSITLTDGYSNRVYTFAKLSGGGSFILIDKGGTNFEVKDTFVFIDTTDFSGTLSATSYRTIKLGTTPCAKVNGIVYSSLADAIVAANAGDTIMMVADSAGDVTIDKAITLQGTATLSGALSGDGSLTIASDANITLTANSTFSGRVVNNGTLTTRGNITFSNAKTTEDLGNIIIGTLHVAEGCLTMKAANNGNGFKGTITISAGAELKPQTDYSMSVSAGTTVNIYGAVTLDCIWTVHSDVTWNLYSDGILQSNMDNANAYLNVDPNATINLVPVANNADTEAGKVLAVTKSNALTYHVTGPLALDTLDLSTCMPDAKLTFANTSVVLTVKNLILGTNRDFMGNSLKSQLVVTGSVSMTEGPTEGSPIEVTWTMAETVPVTMTMANGGTITTDSEQGGGFTIDTDGNLVFVTTLTGKGCWYEWLFDAGTLDSTGRVQHEYSKLGTELGENYDLKDYYISAPKSPTGTERKALKLSAKVLQDHLDYSESLEAPNWSSSFFARMPSNEGGVLVSFGSAPRATKGALALVRGKNENQVVLVYIRAGHSSCEVLADMKVPHAETDYHLYSFVKYGDRIEIFLDDKLWSTVKGDYSVSTGIKMGGLYYYQWSGGSQTQETLGTYTADVNGGRITLVGAADVANDETPGAIDMLRIYDCYLELAEVRRIAEEYPYESPYGAFTRTISTATANWNDTGVWTKTLNNKTSSVAYPTDGVATLTATVATKVTVNMPEAAELEGLTLTGSDITLSAGAETKHITVTGSTLINANVNVDCNAISLEGPVEIISGKTLTLTLTDALLTKWGTEYIANGLAVTKNLTGYVTMGAAVGSTPAATLDVVAPDVGQDDKAWTKTTNDQGIITFTKDNFILTVKLDETTNCWTATLDHKAWTVTIAADGTKSWQLGEATYTPTDTETVFLEGATLSVIASANAELTLNGTTKGMTITKGDDATGDVTVTLLTPTNKVYNYLQLNDLILGEGVTVVLAGDVRVTKQPTMDDSSTIVVGDGTTMAPATRPLPAPYFPDNGTVALNYLGTTTITAPLAFNGMTLKFMKGTHIVAPESSAGADKSYTGCIYVDNGAEMKIQIPSKDANDKALAYDAYKALGDGMTIKVAEGATLELNRGLAYVNIVGAATDDVGVATVTGDFGFGFLDGATLSADLVVDKGAKLTFRSWVIESIAVPSVTVNGTIATSEYTDKTVALSVGKIGGTGTVSVPVTFTDGAILDATAVTTTDILTLTGAVTKAEGTSALTLYVPATAATGVAKEYTALKLPAETAFATEGVTFSVYAAGEHALIGDVTVALEDAESAKALTVTIAANNANAILPATVTTTSTAGGTAKEETLSDATAQTILQARPEGVTTVTSVTVTGTTRATTLETHSVHAADHFTDIVTVDNAGAATVAYDFGVERFMMKRLLVDEAPEATYIVLKAKVKNATDTAGYAKDTKVKVVLNDKDIDLAKIRELTDIGDILATGLEAAAGDIKASAKYFLIDLSVLSTEALEGARTETFKVKVTK